MKEFGSDFDYCDQPQWLAKPSQAAVFSPELFQFFVSGRSALWALLAHGVATKQWQRVYLPSYYCHEVGQFLQGLGIVLHSYPYNPWDNNPIDAQAIIDASDSVVLDVHFFGLARADFSGLKKAVRIEDLTHNILGFAASQADYCFASLRKELPVPVGGYCYSPKGLALPSPVRCLQAEQLCLKKLVAMYLKQQFLAGQFGHKPVFRAMLQQAEAGLANTASNAAMPSAAVAVLEALDVAAMLEAKQQNIANAQARLAGLPLTINFNQRQAGLGLLLALKQPEQAEALRQYLLARNIFPAVLWPGQQNPSDQQAMQKMLMVHVDYRYNVGDVAVICQAISEFFYGQ